MISEKARIIKETLDLFNEEITFREFLILSLLPLTAGKICQALKILPAQGTRCFSRLEKLEYITRQFDSKDHRKVVMTITNKGQEAFLKYERMIGCFRY